MIPDEVAELAARTIDGPCRRNYPQSLLCDAHLTTWRPDEDCCTKIADLRAVARLAVMIDRGGVDVGG